MGPEMRDDCRCSPCYWHVQFGSKHDILDGPPAWNAIRGRHNTVG